MLTANGSNAWNEISTRSLSTSLPGATVTSRRPLKVSGAMVPDISAASDSRRAMLACVKVAGAVPNRFDSRTRAVVPPNVGVKIARTVPSRSADFGFIDWSNWSRLSLPREASDGAAAQTPSQPWSEQLGGGAAIAVPGTRRPTTTRTVADAGYLRLCFDDSVAGRPFCGGRTTSGSSVADGLR